MTIPLTNLRNTWTFKFSRPALGKRVSLWLGTWIIVEFILIAMAAPILAPLDPGVKFSTYRHIRLDSRLPQPPQAGLILGSVTDTGNMRQLDIWYSFVWGTRSALSFGFLVVLFTSAFGIVLGAISGYLGGLPNTLIMGFSDAFLAVPIVTGVVFFQQFILMLLRSTGIDVFYAGLWTLPASPTAWQILLTNLDPMVIAFIVFSWMAYARLMNSTIMLVRREGYIQAARALGAGHLHVIFRHLIPNSISPVLVLAARDVGFLVLLQAGFTFIGLSHNSEWGMLLSLGRRYVIGPGGNPFTWWWAYIPPSLAILLFGLGWNLLGDGLSD